VPLNYQLKNGDQVEIMSSKASKGPSRDWLNPVLGYLKTSQAKEKVRAWFKKQIRTENVDKGREMLEKLAKQVGIKLTERDKLAKGFKYDNLDDFYAAIGYGGVTTHQIALKLSAQQQQPRLASITPSKQAASTVSVLGVKDLLTHLAQCCHPVPGDKVTGYITRARGVTVHRQDCHNIRNEKEKDRLVPVEWGESYSMYPVTIQVEAQDRVGLMRDITTLVAEEKININAVNLNNNTDHTINTLLTLETANLAQLSSLLTKIEGIRGVISVVRIGTGASPKSSGQQDTVRSQ
jgi:GTP pyrophosphokinase